MSSSRHVFGSGTTIVGVMPTSLRAASGFGPRTTDFTSLTAARNCVAVDVPLDLGEQMPRADAGEKDHDVDLAGDQPIGEVDRGLIVC